jgi:hypothetical protein
MFDFTVPTLNRRFNGKTFDVVFVFQWFYLSVISALGIIQKSLKINVHEVVE